MVRGDMEHTKVLNAFFISVFTGKTGIPGPRDMRGNLEQESRSFSGEGSGSRKFKLTEVDINKSLRPDRIYP